MTYLSSHHVTRAVTHATCTCRACVLVAAYTTGAGAWTPPQKTQGQTPSLRRGRREERMTDTRYATNKRHVTEQERHNSHQQSATRATNKVQPAALRTMLAADLCGNHHQVTCVDDDDVASVDAPCLVSVCVCRCARACAMCACMRTQPLPDTRPCTQPLPDTMHTGARTRTNTRTHTRTRERTGKQTHPHTQDT